MGLDSVELVMEFEDEFGISIPDEHATSMLTIGDVAAYVTAVGRGVEPDLPVKTPPGPCAGSRAFYAWRRVLTTQLRLDRRDVVPRARLGDLVPRAARRNLWQAAANAGIHVPGLRAPAGLVGIAGAIGVVAGLQVALHVHPGLLFVTVTAVGAAGLYLLDSVRWTLPAGCGTMAGLARASWVPLEALEAPTAVDERWPMDPDVLRKVCVIVSEQMGVPVNGLTPATRFVEDLHVD